VNCWESCGLKGACFISLLHMVIKAMRVLEVAHDMTIPYNTGRFLKRFLCLDADTLYCVLS